MLGRALATVALALLAGFSVLFLCAEPATAGQSLCRQSGPGTCPCELRVPQLTVTRSCQVFLAFSLPDMLFLIFGRGFLLLFVVVKHGESRLPFELESQEGLPASCGG
jgi:hypothetical protein